MRVLRRPYYSKQWNTPLFSFFQKLHPCLCTHSWNICFSYPFPFACKKQKRKENVSNPWLPVSHKVQCQQRAKEKWVLTSYVILSQGSCLASGVKTRFLPCNILLINVTGEIMPTWACHMVGNNVSHSALYKHAFPFRLMPKLVLKILAFLMQAHFWSQCKTHELRCPDKGTFHVSDHF